MAPDTTDADGRTVWVGNLDSRVSEELLWELFLQAGPLESVRIPKDYKTGKLRNFAFVVFQHEVSVPYVMELMNQIKLFDSPLRICLKNKPSNDNAPNEQDHMRHHIDQQDRYNTHSPILQDQSSAWHTIPPSLMSQHSLVPMGFEPVPMGFEPVPMGFEPRPDDIAYLNSMKWAWEEPRMPHRRREDHLMRRSYSSPHRSHEESRRPQPYNRGRRYR